MRMLAFTCARVRKPPHSEAGAKTNLLHIKLPRMGGHGSQARIHMQSEHSRVYERPVVQTKGEIFISNDKANRTEGRHASANAPGCIREVQDWSRRAKGCEITCRRMKK